MVNEVKILHELMMPLVTHIGSYGGVKGDRTYVELEPFTEVEKEGMHPLWWLKSEHNNNGDSHDSNYDNQEDVLIMILEILLLLCQKREIRKLLLKAKIYPILRNLDLAYNQSELKNDNDSNNSNNSNNSDNSDDNNNTLSAGTSSDERKTVSDYINEIVNFLYVDEEEGEKHLDINNNNNDDDGNGTTTMSARNDHGVKNVTINIAGVTLSPSAHASHLAAADMDGCDALGLD